MPTKVEPEISYISVRIRAREHLHNSQRGRAARHTCLGEEPATALETEDATRAILLRAAREAGCPECGSQNWYGQGHNASRRFRCCQCGAILAPDGWVIQAGRVRYRAERFRLPRLPRGCFAIHTCDSRGQVYERSY